MRTVHVVDQTRTENSRFEILKMKVLLQICVSSNRILQWSAPKPSTPPSSAIPKQVGGSVGGDFDEDEAGDKARQFFNSFLSLLCLLPVAVDVVLGVGLPLMMVVAVLNCLVAAVAAVGSALSGFGRKVRI